MNLLGIYNKCIDNGISLPENFLENYDTKTYTSVYLHSYLTKNIENKEKCKLDDDAWNDAKNFYRKYMSNPNSIFYIDTKSILPDVQKCINIVKEAGGKVSIPHIYEYKDKSEKILQYLLDNTEIDGIECYYTTFTKNQTEHLLKICKEKNKYISGGSDYHGTYKPDIELGVGYGDLKIPTDIVKDWL